MKRFLTRLLDYAVVAAFLGGIGAGLVALANQSSLFSPTTGTVSGLNLTNNFNSAIDALNTCNSGASAPANQLSAAPALGNCWLDTSVSPKRLKYYDGTSWLIVGSIDDTNHRWVPVTGGGTVQSIASATTTDLCSANNNFATYVSITGTTTIQSFGSNCATGQIKFGVFTGILTLTHNATSFILPFNGVNKTTAAGDTFAAVHLGSGNWRILPYQNATGSPTIAAPTQQVLTSGTSYVPTSGAVRIKVRMIGGGGGGGAASTNNGATGGTTSFNSITAIGGGGGVNGGTGGRTGGAGGTGGAGSASFRLPGSAGSNGTASGATNSGGNGAPGIFGMGAGQAAPQGGPAAGGAAAANTGAGGGGANNSTNGGGSGGSGEYVELPYLAAANYTYAIGAGGNGGAAGGNAGGNGGSGIIIVDEFYF